MATFDAQGDKNELRRQKREARRQQELNELENMDILDMGRGELDLKAQQELQRMEEAADDQQPDDDRSPKKHGLLEIVATQTVLHAVCYFHSSGGSYGRREGSLCRKFSAPHV